MCLCLARRQAHAWDDGGHGLRAVGCWACCTMGRALVYVCACVLSHGSRVRVRVHVCGCVGVGVGVM